MTGRENIEAALSEGGAFEIPVIIPYEELYVRDHWRELTSTPWWYHDAPDIKRQMSWRREVIANIKQDSLSLPLGVSKEDRDNTSIIERPSGVFLVDRRTGREKLLNESPIGGEVEAETLQPPAHLPETPEEIDDLIPSIWPGDRRFTAADFDSNNLVADGGTDLPAELLREFGEDLYPLGGYVNSPLEDCFDLWGFNEGMKIIVRHPDLVRHACQRFLSLYMKVVQAAAATGAAGIWVQDCMSNMISPKSFAELNVPFARQLVEGIRAAGMKSFYYFCGDPAGKWDLLVSIGADALAFEEGKKGFKNEIDDIVKRVRGRTTVLGNLDSIGVLENGTEKQLRAEISRQLAAGRQNGGRFIMSLGSPITPHTPLERVRLYCDLAHELGASV